MSGRRNQATLFIEAGKRKANGVAASTTTSRDGFQRLFVDLAVGNKGTEHDGGHGLQVFWAICYYGR